MPTVLDLSSLKGVKMENKITATLITVDNPSGFKISAKNFLELLKEIQNVFILELQYVIEDFVSLEIKQETDNV